MSSYAGDYVKAFSLGLVLQAFIDNQRRFLNMVGWSHLPMMCQGAGLVLHVMLCFIFVRFLELGIQGIGFAGSISLSFTYGLLLHQTSKIKDLREAVFYPSREVIRGIITHLRLAVPSAMMLCLGWWAFEVISILVGNIGVEEQAANFCIF